MFHHSSCGGRSLVGFNDVQLNNNNNNNHLDENDDHCLLKKGNEQICDQPNSIAQSGSLNKNTEISNDTKVCDHSTSQGDSYISNQPFVQSLYSKDESCSADTHEQAWPTSFDNQLLLQQLQQQQNELEANDSADSSYDSDQESINANSDMKKFVVDLIDSGNSTTPEDEVDADFVVNAFQLDPPASTTLMVNDAQPLTVSPSSASCSSFQASPNSQLSSEHEEVNRTVSETLRQEYSEYVTKQICVGPSHQLHSTPEVDAEQKNEDELDLTNAKVNSLYHFALKLRYTESQFKQALAKLGPQVDENELLAELIVIGASADQIGRSGKTDKPNRDDGLLKNSKAPLKQTLSGGSSLRPIVIDGSNVAIRLVVSML